MIITDTHRGLTPDQWGVVRTKMKPLRVGRKKHWSVLDVLKSWFVVKQPGSVCIPDLGSELSGLCDPWPGQTVGICLPSLYHFRHDWFLKEVLPSWWLQYTCGMCDGISVSFGAIFASHLVVQILPFCRHRGYLGWVRPVSTTGQTLPVGG